MKKETFVHGVTILEETFNKTLNRMIAWEILREIDDEKFMGAVRIMVRELKTLFPNDNLVAIAMEHVNEYTKRSYQNKLAAEQQRPALDWEPCPPPAEWDELKQKLAGGRIA